MKATNKKLNKPLSDGEKNYLNTCGDYARTLEKKKKGKK